MAGDLNAANRWDGVAARAVVVHPVRWSAHRGRWSHVMVTVVAVACRPEPTSTASRPSRQWVVTGTPP